MRVRNVLNRHEQSFTCPVPGKSAHCQSIRPVCVSLPVGRGRAAASHTGRTACRAWCEPLRSAPPRRRAGTSRANTHSARTYTPGSAQNLTPGSSPAAWLTVRSAGSLPRVTTWLHPLSGMWYLCSKRSVPAARLAIGSALAISIALRHSGQMMQRGPSAVHRPGHAADADPRGGHEPVAVPESLWTNADDRLPRAPLGRVEGGDGIVEGRDVADVRPQPSVPHPLHDLTQLATIGLDNEVDRQAARRAAPRAVRRRTPAFPRPGSALRTASGCLRR